MKHFFAVTFLLCSTSTFAMFCPNNFNNINMGDTPEQVQQQCGNPLSQNTFTNSHSESEEWVYYKKPTSIYDNGMVKMTLLINNNKLANINITNSNTGQTATCVSTAQQFGNNAPSSMNCNIAPHDTNVASSTLCGINIQVGESAEAITVACGQPAAVTQSQQQNSQNMTTEVTEWKYQGTPIVTLVFENGKLKERK